ncbi:MAG: ComEC/Rec2 family competence protein, partial [Solirubrobacteraceae bacterium]|nr:ComEC/Rec2 family competence protein [Solirubrobacteraceae bacterium]
MSTLLRNARAVLTTRTARRVGIADELRVPQVALVWAAAAVGLAVGGAISGAPRAAGVVLLLAIAATRPGRRPRGHPLLALHAVRRPLVWVLVAAALLVGGARSSAIDASATPVTEREIGRAKVVLTERLPAATGPRSPTALAQIGGQKVQIVAPRFGSGPVAVPRGGIAKVDGKLVPLRDRPGDDRLRRQGVAGRLLATEIEPLAARRGGVLGAVDRFAAAAEDQLVESLGARRGTLVAGMALGTADGISESDATALRTSGLWHLVAASGGNIALVVALVFALGWIVGAGDRTRLLVAALAVCLYVPLAGAGPSIQRAGVMGLAGLLALAMGREHRGLTALALAAAATLALDPRAWLDVGWQLSFAAAGGLITVGPWLARALASYGLPRSLAAGLACTLIATVATAPIMLATFGELSLIGLVANAVILPVVGVVVWSGALAAVLTPIAPVVAGLVAAPAGVGAGITLAVAAWASTRTHAVIGLTEVAALVVGIGLLAVVRPPPVAVAGI